MRKVIKPDGSVEFYRGNDLVAVKKPVKPKYPVPRAFKNFKFSRPEMDFRLPEEWK